MAVIISDGQTGQVVTACHSTVMLRKVAEELLQVVGGDIVNSPNYYLILNGGSDDICGITVSDSQIGNWSLISLRGELVHSLLIMHANKEPKAFGACCYSLEIVESILEAVKNWRPGEEAAA